MESIRPQPRTGFSAEKLDLLDHLLAEEGFDIPPAIPRRRDPGPPPLSFGQLRLWFLERWQPQTPVYHISSVYRFAGRLDLGCLERSIQEIAWRHEVLRTTFRMDGNEPVQAIAPGVDARLPLVDLEELPTAAREAEAERLAASDARRPFDLVRGPVWRAAALRLGREEHALLLTLHHIISDGWSTGVMAREIEVLYRAFSHGEEPALPELPIQYADFAVWQRQELAGGALTEQIDYWCRQLAGAPGLLDLPADHPRRPSQGGRGASRLLRVAPEVGRGLEALARREGTTLFTALLAAFDVLLHRYTAAEDLVVGSPIANRNHKETEGLIGFFVNMLALRVRPTEERTFRELLREVRDVSLAAYDHQDVPFEALLERLQLERTPSHTPLFQVVLVLQNAPLPAIELPGLAVAARQVATGTAKFDLMLTFTATGHVSSGEIAGEIEYRRELFEPGTIDRLAGHLGVLLAGIVEAPEGRIGDLPLLSRAERDQLLCDWNRPPGRTAGEAALHRRFEAQAARAPDAVALVADDVALTYAELDRRANRIAACLRALGVGPEERVGLCVESSPEMVFGILGVLKAGGAYVPLDPADPRERLSLILESAAPAAVLAQARLKVNLPAGRRRVVQLDFWKWSLPAPGDADLSAEVPPDAAVYVLHTSGSTGRPKGVVVTHRNVARLFSATDERYGFGPQDVWTLAHSFSFDFSVWELWGALLYGGRMVLVPRQVARAPESFCELLRREGVTVLSQTPSGFLPLARAERVMVGQGPLALRWVVFGGEALEFQALAPWFERHGDRIPALVNMYGITEITVHATYRRVTAADLALGSSRIGGPIPDLRLYLVDPRLELVPAGVPGEICVAGDGVARGYLGDPALTAARFVPDPWSGVPGGRMYRSGDLARYREGGDLEYLGRIDFQVKVRGHRIEVGEIETILARHPAVAEAAVIARQDVAGGGRLVAYFVPAAGPEPPLGKDLRAFLERRLPGYMVPAAFVQLERLPLTSNGKLDRRALPAPGIERPDVGTPYRAPRTPAEEVLAQIWMQVLGLDRVGVDDNFFALGGDSILSLRVHALAAERGLHFTLPQLFSQQTVAQLAREIEGAAEPLAETPAAPFALLAPQDRERLPPGIEDAYPLTAVQSGMLYHMRYTPGSIIYHNLYSYQLVGRLDAEAFQRAAQRVVQRHPILRTSFDLTSYGEPLQLVHETAAIPVGAEDLSDLPPAEQERVLDAFMEEEKRRGFDLSRPPLVRLHLHRRSASRFNFTFTEFHPIFDGWSLHSFLAEVFANYFALLEGSPQPDGEPLRLAVRNFVALERAAVESQEQRSWWERALAGARPVPLPRWGGADRDAAAGRIRVADVGLPALVQDGLRRLARAAAVPLKSVLLAAHLKVMSRMAGSSDVLTGLLSNGRPEGPDGDRILGLFFNVVPFRTRLADGTWEDLARTTFVAEREMFPFRRYPLARLQQSHGGKPLFEVIFNYIHFHVLRDLLGSGRVGLTGDFRRWEETNIPLSTTFIQEPIADELRLVLRYDSEQIAPWQVASLGRMYERTLAEMAHAPGVRHELQSLLSEAEQHQVLREWGGTGFASRSPVTVHELFEAQADRTPDAVAAVFGDEALTYAELDARANRLARRLGRAGVGPEARVGIYMQRSLEMLVALLGVLKAGAAYVPLDPLNPYERTAFLLAEAGISLVLTQRRLAQATPAPVGLSVLELDLGWEEVSREDGGRIPRPIPDGCAAYLLFTSGSTGSPKGVVVEHRQLVSYVLGVQECIDFPPGARFAMASSFAADLGNTALFPSLCGGGCLHVLSEERSADPELWEEYCARCPLDVLKIVPSHLAALLSSPGAAAMLPQARLVLGGETLDGALVARIRALARGTPIFNHYGPTETTVGVTAGRLAAGAEVPTGAAAAPLGRPLAGARIHVLGEGLVPVPPVSPGELCVGGATLARGYFGWPEATAERFVPNPFAARPGERLYRTGDLARWLPDGRIEFLGRMDGQVKVRGFRVELREIELALGRHPGVREAAVAVRRDRAGEPRLIAFVVAADGSLPPDSELRSFLRRLLPDYMLPAGYLPIEALPRTANGKLDRTALPEAADLAASWRSDYVAPRNELERTIAAVWQEVLGVDKIGVDDNLFDLGGHSLVMLRIHSKLRGAVAPDLPMVALFEHPTVADLARHLSGGVAQAPAAPAAAERAEARHAAHGRRRQARIPAADAGEAKTS